MRSKNYHIKMLYRNVQSRKSNSNTIATVRAANEKLSAKLYLSTGTGTSSDIITEQHKHQALHRNHRWSVSPQPLLLQV